MSQLTNPGFEHDPSAGEAELAKLIRLLESYPVRSKLNSLGLEKQSRMPKPLLELHKLITSQVDLNVLYNGKYRNDKTSTYTVNSGQYASPINIRMHFSIPLINRYHKSAEVTHPFYLEIVFSARNGWKESGLKTTSKYHLYLSLRNARLEWLSQRVTEDLVGCCVLNHAEASPISKQSVVTSLFFYDFDASQIANLTVPSVIPFPNSCIRTEYRMPGNDDTTNVVSIGAPRLPGEDSVIRFENFEFQRAVKDLGYYRRIASHSSAEEAPSQKSTYLDLGHVRKLLVNHLLGAPQDLVLNSPEEIDEMINNISPNLHVSEYLSGDNHLVKWRETAVMMRLLNLQLG